MKTGARVGIAAIVLAGAIAVLSMRNAERNAPRQATNISAATTTAPSADAVAALPRLLDLGATKCIPCKAMAPILEDLKKTYAGRMHVEFVDVWVNPGVAEQYGVQSIPTQIFFDAGGNELYRHTGFFAKDEILAKCRELGFKLE